MFDVEKQRKMQAAASIASEFSFMCRTVAMTGRGESELDGKGAVRFLGFSCGVATMLCENAKFDSETTKQVLLMMFEINLDSKSAAQNTFDALTDLIRERIFIRAIATGKTAVNRWGASGGFPVAGGRLLGELLDVDENAV